jgi:hypothetical protein
MGQIDPKRMFPAAGAVDAQRQRGTFPDQARPSAFSPPRACEVVRRPG